MNTRRWRYLWGAVLVFALFGPLPPASAQAPVIDAGATKTPVTGLLQWQKDGVPLVTALGNQREPQIVTDGAEGGIVLWRDYRPSWSPFAHAHLYAQRISASGQTLWQQDGVLVASQGDQRDPQVVSDEQGGAIVTWWDNRTGLNHVFAQRLGTDGALRWGADGLQLSASTGNQVDPQLASDGAGGAFIAWIDRSDESSPAVRVQHVLADGSYAWGANGVVVKAPGQEQFSPELIADGAGGLIVAWRGYCAPGWEGLCLQRVRADGTYVWDKEVIISVSSKPFPNTQLQSDGQGGAFVVWVDQRNLDNDIYAQRVAADGKTQWASGGVAVIATAGDQELPRIISDGQDGVIVAWHNARPAEQGLYLQHLDLTGRTTWGSGVPIAAKNQGTPSAQPPDVASTTWLQPYYDIVSDGGSGALVAWWGYVETGAESRGGIWMQRVAADGAKVWPDRGVLAQWDNRNMGLGVPDLLNDTAGGAIVVWEDNRRWYKVDEYDIYAQRVVEGTYRRYLPMIAH
jgi:hypothetical protein